MGSLAQEGEEATAEGGAETAATKGKRKGWVEGSERAPKKRKPRKPRYPKGFDPADPGPPPDPERWLPKHERAVSRVRLPILPRPCSLPVRKSFGALKMNLSSLTYCVCMSCVCLRRLGFFGCAPVCVCVCEGV